MAKFTAASEYVRDYVREVSTELGLAQMGIDFETLCVPKAKEVVTVSKASNVVEYISEREDLVLVVVYERAFEVLSKEDQYMLIRLALNTVDMSSETGKVVMGCPMISLPVHCYEKFKGVAVEPLLRAQYTMQQIKEMDEQKKAEEAAKKKGKKKGGSTE